MGTPIDEFNNLTDDKARWLWILNYKSQFDIKLILDNDDTIMVIEGYSGYGQFDDYIGWSDGAFALLEAIGIKAESV